MQPERISCRCLTFVSTGYGWRGVGKGGNGTVLFWSWLLMAFASVSYDSWMGWDGMGRNGCIA